jgi:hypothetical protein
VGFDFALPAAPRIRVWVITSERAYPLHDSFETVSGTIVVIPVAPGWPMDRTGASDGTANSMNCQIEMATKRLVQVRLAICRTATDVRRFQIDMIM